MTTNERDVEREETLIAAPETVGEDVRRRF
jgi:hypothetical protein